MILIERLKHKRVELPKITRHNPCNPSIIAVPGGYECTVRGVNYDLEKEKGAYNFFYGSFDVPFADTQNYYAKLDNDLNLLSCRFIEDRHIRANDWAVDGVEDLRLFWWKDMKWVIGNALHHPSVSTRMLLARLDGSLLNDWMTFDSPKGSHMEKNWMPWVRGESLCFVYKPDNMVFYPDGEGLITTDPFHHENLENDSGGSCITEHEGRFWAITHTRTNFSYHHRLVEYDGFEDRVIQSSREFKLEGAPVEFCAGIAFKYGQITLSYGVMDKKAVITQFNFDELLEALGME
jgi:hypothetical protein